MGADMKPFEATLARHGLKLERCRTHTLQVNTGFLCDLVCGHCHLEAGPHRTEVMSPETMADILEYASRTRFQTIDVTGGAPELVPRIKSFLKELSPLADRLVFRTNLVALPLTLMELCRDLRVTLVASFPSTNAAKADSQRGTGIWEKSISALRQLNALGYGKPAAGLELDLVTNPPGALLPDDQQQTEKEFRTTLQQHGVVFTSLFAFANAPLGRFGQWLDRSGKREEYLSILTDRFNPDAICGLMCRSLVSVSYNGYLHDCDFNLAAGIWLGRKKIHVSEMPGFPAAGTPVPTAEHCYACTAGSGFT